MTAQILDRILSAWRLGDPDGRHPIFDATGSTLFPGRWNGRVTPVIYASEYYSTAMLEKLAHGNGRLPPNQHSVRIAVPPGVPYEIFPSDRHRGWDDPDCAVARTYGEAWQRSGRSLLLLVPSLVARVDRNVLINPSHPDFSRITHSLHEPVWWDERLFPKTFR